MASRAGISDEPDTGLLSGHAGEARGDLGVSGQTTWPTLTNVGQVARTASPARAQFGCRAVVFPEDLSGVYLVSDGVPGADIARPPTVRAQSRWPSSVDDSKREDRHRRPGPAADADRPVAGIAPAMLVTRGTVGISHRGGVPIRTSDQPVRTEADEGISADAIRRAVAQVADELAARLDQAFGGQRR